MADSESNDCPCSNIAIMQLFHELKQRYPTVPDQIVSKVIQENCHDKSACETILQKENYIYVQSYPGAIISGNSRESGESGSLCNQCPNRFSQQPGNFQGSCQSVFSNNHTTENCQNLEIVKNKNAFFQSENSGIYLLNPDSNVDASDHVVENLKEDKSLKHTDLEKAESFEKISLNKSKSCHLKNNFEEYLKNERMNENSLLKNSSEVLSESKSSLESTETSTQTYSSKHDSDGKSDILESFQASFDLTNSNCGCCSEVGSVRLNVDEKGKKSEGSTGIINHPVASVQPSIHNYQVAVEYSMQPVKPINSNGQQRSFTRVNLSLRPPSSEPQPPIEIQSGQNLTYTTSVFDAKKGVQSQFQIMIGPGGGGTVSACRTYISSPQSMFCCRLPYCTPQISTGFNCHNNHHLEALLEKQRERKNLLEKELGKEKDKLNHLRNGVKLMQATIAQKPNPHILPRLKVEIEKLRAECEKLTTAVDLYAGSQSSLPLGETDEEFYRNIYTGQRLQREGSWSCQLCTFRNHPLLNVCEECEMPRITLGSEILNVESELPNVLPNNNTFCMGGGISTSASLITAPLRER